MGNFKFYHIEDEYIEFLHKIDQRVQYNKNESRPYIGVVLQIDKFTYFVPLESPKPNHANLKGGGPVLKLDEGRLGVMGFNNMIPANKEHLICFDINDIDDERYKTLLLKQLIYCNKNKDLILRRANATYTKALSGKNEFYRKVCCDFKKIEESVKLFRKRRKKCPA